MLRNSMSLFLQEISLYNHIKFLAILLPKTANEPGGGGGN